MKEDLDRKEGAVPPGIEIPGIPARKLVNETVPDGFRPVFSGTIMMTGNNGQVWNIRCHSDGECYLSGSASIGYMYSVLGVWVAS